MQKRKTVLFITLIGLLVLIFTLSIPNRPAPQAQIIYATPTADSDGRILYTVQDQDTCLGVALKNNITLDQLLALNNLNDQCTLITGTNLVIATVAPQIGPTETATPGQPTPTPEQGVGSVCIKLFDDVNGNGIPESNETAIVDGAISITDRSGQISLTGKTSNSMEEPTCFEEIEQGDYNVSVAVPEGYNATTQLNRAFQLAAGDNSMIDFGAQLSSSAAPVPVEEGGRSPLLAILGGLILVAGVGIAIYAQVSRR